MSNHLKFSRTIGQMMSGLSSSIPIWKEGIVQEVQRDASYIRVLLLPEEKDLWARYMFPLGYNNVQVGAMPDIDSRVIVFNIPNDSENDELSDLIAFGGIFDDGLNIKPEIPDDASDDKLYFTITQKNGNKIQLYKNNDGESIVNIITPGHLNITVDGNVTQTVKGDVTMDVDGKVDINNGQIELGKGTLRQLVDERHLPKYNAIADEIAGNAQDLATSLVPTMLGLMPLLKDASIPWAGIATARTTVITTNKETADKSLTSDTKSS